jgi:hypothetical protein
VKTHVKKYPQVEMLPVETKRSGGKLLPHSDLRRGVFPEEVSRNRKRDIVLGTWNVRSLYRGGSLTAVARELARYKLDLMGVQEVRWDKVGTVRAGDYKFFYGNAPAHRSILVTEFLAKNKLITLEHPPYSPDLSPANFYLLPRTQSEMKRRRFCDITRIIKKEMKELKKFSQYGCQKCFQHLYRLWQKCIFAQGDYFEGNVCEMIIMFRISYKLSDSGNILKLPCV